MRTSRRIKSDSKRKVSSSQNKEKERKEESRKRTYNPSLFEPSQNIRDHGLVSYRKQSLAHVLLLGKRV